MRLSEQEQDQLHLLIVAFIGEDAAISQARPRFTEQTFSVGFSDVSDKNGIKF